MKFTFTLLCSFVILTAANAKVLTVTCQNSPSHFLPVTLNAVVGDSIHWVWVAGTHIVGPINASTDIPTGAASFDAPIDPSNHSYYYVVKTPGNYHYVCHPATPHGEDAYIVVAPLATGIQPYNPTSNLSVAYPNPFSDKLTIETPNADQILIFNALGEKVRTLPLKSGQTKIEADLANLPKGLFIYCILKEGVLLETKKIIKN
jgi:plastocyanin